MQSSAQAPLIHVRGEEEPIGIGFDAVAAYHGQSALAMLAITFQGLRASLALLSPDAPPSRVALTVVSGHPGPGVRDAFEFVTRAVTRNAYTVDRSLPDARLNSKADISYSFRISLDGETVQAALRDNVLPQRFFDLVTMRNRMEAEVAELSALKRRIALTALALAPETLFVMRRMKNPGGQTLA